jgi:cell division septal protein FtsQ
MKRKSRRRIQGVIPATFGMLWSSLRWMIRHPQTGFVVAAIGILGWALWGYVQRAEAFRIARVQFPPNSDLTLSEPLLGENLLTIDLRRLSRSLKAQQPALKEIRIVRQLPNTLRIEPISRTPVAQVKLDRWYPVDGAGFVMPKAETQPLDRLIRIVGVDRAAVRPGQENDEERLRLGLRVLTTVRRAPFSISRRVLEVNVSDPQQIRFLMDGDTEVRCGTEAELDAHLARLRAALKAMSRQSLDAQYIDVRFHEPVVHPRT